MAFAERFERELVHQPGRRTVAETLEVGWQLLESVPRDDLLRLGEEVWARRQAEKEKP
jgi:vacuolar-type H+-ATPase subunit B/Vma2